MEEVQLEQACSFPKSFIPGTCKPAPPASVGKPWIFGSLLAEPIGELNIQTDKGVQSYFRIPHCPSRWFWARWLRSRGRGGGSQVFVVAAEM